MMTSKIISYAAKEFAVVSEVHPDAGGKNLIKLKYPGRRGGTTRTYEYSGDDIYDLEVNRETMFTVEELEEHLKFTINRNLFKVAKEVLDSEAKNRQVEGVVARSPRGRTEQKSLYEGLDLEELLKEYHNMHWHRVVLCNFGLVADDLSEAETALCGDERLYELYNAVYVGENILRKPEHIVYVDVSDYERRREILERRISSHRKAELEYLWKNVYSFQQPFLKWFEQQKKAIRKRYTDARKKLLERKEPATVEENNFLSDKNMEMHLKDRQNRMVNACRTRPRCLETIEAYREYINGKKDLFCDSNSSDSSSDSDGSSSDSSSSSESEQVPVLLHIPEKGKPAEPSTVSGRRATAAGSPTVI